MLIGWQNIYTNDAYSPNPASHKRSAGEQSAGVGLDGSRYTLGLRLLYIKTLITFCFSFSSSSYSLSRPCSSAMNNKIENAFTVY
jgi:hypothetical protein